MSPCVADHADGRLFALGSPGASRIPTALAQVWWPLAWLGLEPAAAIAAPRLHVGSAGAGGPLLLHEPGALDPLQPLTAKSLQSLGLEDEQLQAFPAPDMYFGGVKLAARMADGQLIALADPRRQGSVALTD
jgi:gamma-glutamyltranspeptidase/glutathione hydrolase